MAGPGTPESKRASEPRTALDSSERRPGRQGSRSDEAGWSPQSVGTVGNNERERICGQNRSRWRHDHCHDVRWFVGLRAFAVITGLARVARSVLARAIAEPFARSVLVCLSWAAVVGCDDMIGGSHLCLAATRMRDPRQPETGQGQQGQENCQ
jgi:hypothetical protein